MSEATNTFGGHVLTVEGTRLNSSNSSRRQWSAYNILGRGGWIRPAAGTNKLAVSDLKVQRQLDVLRFFARHGINVLYTFAHPDGGLSTEDEDDIEASLNILKDPAYGVKALEYGNEVQGLQGQEQDKYWTDLQWFVTKAGTYMPAGTKVYGPSVTGTEDGYNFLDDYFNESGAPWADGVDVHSFAYELLDPGASNDWFFRCVQLSRTQETPHPVISTEFCGCAWGHVIVQIGGQPEDFYRGEFQQAATGLANVLQAFVGVPCPPFPATYRGVDLVFWSAFPEDIRWTSPEEALLNHTGVCVGAWAAQRCYDAAGSWRLIAYVLQLAASLWRDYDIVSQGKRITQDVPTDARLFEFETPRGVAYAFFLYEPEQHEPVLLTLTPPSGTHTIVEANFELVSTNEVAYTSGDVEYDVQMMPKVVLFLT